jgi:hypothetical protein
MNTRTFIYSVKIWATAAFIAPFLQCCIDFFVKPNFDPGYLIYSTVSMGVILSVPSLVLFWFTTLCMKKIAYNDTLAKLFLTMPGIILMVMLVYFAGKFQQFAAESAYLPIPYVIAIVAVIWAYELPVLDRERYYATVNA